MNGQNSYLPSQGQEQGPNVGPDMSQFANNYTPQFNSPSPGGGGPLAGIMGMLGLGGEKEMPGGVSAVQQQDINNTGASIANQGNMTSMAPSQGMDAGTQQNVGSFMSFM